MIKNFPHNAALVLIVLAFSTILVVLAAFAESRVQGPLNVPGDIEFLAYLPGKYSVYRESIVDAKDIPNAAAADYGLNEILQCQVWGCNHLQKLTPPISYTVSSPYCHKDAKTGKYILGVPFAELEILWPGSYHMHAEFTGAVDKHPNVTVGPKYLISIAILISIIAQLIVLFRLLKRSTAERTAARSRRK